MTALLAIITVVTWGCWIPAAQTVPGVPQRTRVLYATLGNLVTASVALAAGGGGVSFGWKAFWLPVVGGAVWVGGNYTAFRASELIGLARANGTWAPFNIIVGFVWGALLFGELSHTSSWRLAVLGVSLVLVVIGVLVIVRSQEAGAAAAAPVAAKPAVAGAPTASSPSSTSLASTSLASTPLAPTPAAAVPRTVVAPTARPATGFLFALAAGGLWGSYFIPAQWAGVAAQVGNFPLALGMVAAGAVLAWSGGVGVRLGAKPAAAQLFAGALFGVGNITLLAMVARVGTGVGFTIAQLSLLVNASIGIYVFKVPRPGSAAARKAIAGLLMAGAGGIAIGAFR